MKQGVKKIVFTGPESTAKTSLAKALALEYGTSWVPEYARFHLNRFGSSYQEADLLTIAKGQLEWEETYLQQAHKYLFCDTSMMVMKVWSDYKYGRTHRWIEQQLAEHRYDLYCLCAPDLPWSYDPLRENENLQERLDLYEHYLTILRKQALPFVELKGNWEARFAKAKKEVDQLSEK